MQMGYQKFGRFRQLLRLVLCSALALFATSAYSASKTILVLGDSLSAEYGLPRGAGWVALLQNRLQTEKIDAEIVNASISGETTSGGATRLPALLEQHHPDLVILELGANDGLRGLSLAATEANLDRMVKASRKAGARVLLIGMRLPPNYGTDYTKKFFSLFANVAKSNNLPFVPFLLEGVATRPELFQADRIHPTAAAHPLILDHVWPVLKPLVKK